MQIQDAEAREGEGEPRALQVPVQRRQTDGQGRIQLTQVQEGGLSAQDPLHLDTRRLAAPQILMTYSSGEGRFGLLGFRLSSSGIIILV